MQIQTEKVIGWMEKDASLAVLVMTTAIAIAVSLISLSSGVFIIFQNLFYIPIIFACIFYLRRGLIFSILLSLLYLALLLSFAGFDHLLNGVIRVIIFITVACVITYLAERWMDSEQSLEKKQEELRTQLEEIVRIRDELTESNEYLGNLITHANAPIIVWDSDVRITKFNGAFGRLTGIPPEQAIGSHLEILFEIFFPDDTRDASMDLIRRAMAGEMWDIVEIPIRHRSGEVRTVLWNSANIRGSDGETIIATIAQGQDITDRKKAESALLQKNEELHAAYEQLTATEEEIRSQLEEIITIRDQLEETNAYLGNLITHANAPIIVWDQQCRITRFNNAFGRLTGISPDEALGKNLTILFPDKTRDESMDLIRRAMAGEMWDVVEIPILHRSGEVRTVLWNSANIRGSDGETIIATIAQGQDITDRKKAESALLQKNEELQLKNEELTAAEEEMRSQLDELMTARQELQDSEAYIRTVLDNLPIGVAVNSVDPEVNFEYFNEQFLRIYRTSAEALSIPDNFWDAVYEDPAFRQELKEQVVLDCASGDPERMHWEDIPIVRQGEKTTYISARNIPVPGKNLVISTVRDITDRKKAEQELHTTNKKLQLFSGITRHDIRNMTMALQAYLELAREEVSDPALSVALSRYLGEIGKAVTAIQKKIEYTKTYEELGMKKPAWQPLSAIVAMIGYEDRLPIRHDCGGVSIYADPMFERVLHNLYENTIRHAGGAERVSIWCEEADDGTLLIIWEDTGPGIPDEQKEQIFEKGVGTSSGLGLFLAREILSLTGIEIHETGVYGEGARFEITVPAGAWRISGVEQS